MLADLGIDVWAGFAADHLVPAPDLVVIGNAVSRGNPEAEAVLARRIPYLSLPEVLREFFIRGKRSVVVTGTHGKTTTTALIAHLFTACDLDPFLSRGRGCRKTSTAPTGLVEARTSSSKATNTTVPSLPSGQSFSTTYPMC